MSNIWGCKIARGALVVPHMLFVDDSYLYCKATEESAQHVLNLLNCFRQASGQQVNLAKSSVFFSFNFNGFVRQVVYSFFRC